MRSSNCRRKSKLKDAILSELAASSNPSMPISPDLIQIRLQHFFPTFQTPIHPPYSSMIRQAILRLNEECGSSEEEISRFLEKEYEGLPWGHASFLSHHLKKLCRNGEIVCFNNDRYMLHVDDGDLGNEEEEMNHGLNISIRDEKEDQTLVQGNGREVEAIDGWSGVNGDQAAESENRCEVERHSVAVNGQNKACEQRIEGFEEQKEGRRESIKEVQEESQNFSGQIEVVEEVDIAKGKLAEVAQEQRGEKRKQPENGWSGVNGDQAAESENRCEVERHSVAVNGQNKACEQRIEGFEEQKEGGRESIKEVQEESQNFSGQIEVVEEVDVAKGKLAEVAQEQRGEKRKQPENGWSGVNGDQAAESENRCEVERHNVAVNGQNKACEERIEGFEEQKEGRRESIKEVQEESQNFSGQIEVVEEVDVAKGKLAEVAQEQRGEKRKQPEKTRQQIKVLKDDIPQPMMEEEKKYVEERQQQIKGGSGVMKSIGEQEQPQRGKMISEQGHPQDQKIDIRTKIRVFPCDGEDVKNLKTSLPERSMHLLEEENKKALEHKGQQKRKLHHRERDSVIVCALPAQLPSQSRTNINQKAHKLHTDSISASLESRELGQILLQQLKLCSPQRPADLQVTTSERFTESEQKPAKFYTRRELQNSQLKVKTSFGMSKNLEELEEKQEQQFRKPEKLLEYEIKTKEATFGGEEAALSISIKVKDSMNVPLDLGQHGREHQKKRIKVYVRRNVRKSQLKESENSNILPTNSE